MFPNMRHLLPLIMLVLVAASCSRTPGYVIPQDKMAALMADIYTGDAVVESSGRTWMRDSVRQVFLHSIYRRHGVTAEQVDTSLNWYGHNIQAYMDMCKLTEELLQERIDEVETQGGHSDRYVASVTADGDSVDVWTGQRWRRNSLLSPSDFTSFVLTPDRNWDRGDRYILSVKGVGTRGPVTLSMAVDYNDGTTEMRTMTMPPEGRNSIILVLDSAKMASSLYGYIKYQPMSGEVSYLDSISLYRTRMRDNNRQLRAGQIEVNYR